MNRTVTTLNAILVMSAAAVGFGKDIYKNDFSSRSSNKDMPGKQWYSTSYVWPAHLCYPNRENVTNCTPLSAYGDLGKIQDGWSLVPYPATGRIVEFRNLTNADADNPFAAAANWTERSMNWGNGMMQQPLYNAFSDGFIRASVDMKCPPSIGGSADEGFRISLLFAAADPIKRATTGPMAVSFGMVEGCKTLRGAGASGWGYSDRIPESGSFDRSHWYRLVVDLELKTGLYTLTAYDMGTSQPLISDPTPSTPYGVGAGHGNPVTAANGPLTAIGFYSYNATRYSVDSTGKVVPAECPAVDNIRLWWRADAGTFTENDLFYENDFKMRRCRTFGSTGKSADYAGELVETNAETYVFWDAAPKDTPYSVNLTSSSTGGRDGWRRVSNDYHNTSVIDTKESGGNVLGAVQNTEQYYVRERQTIGSSFDSGFLKYECDLRTPSAWTGWVAVYWSAAVLGPSGLSSSVIRMGYGAKSKDGKFHPYYLPGSGSAVISDTELKASTWYRVRAVFNKSAKTFSYSLYELGSESGSPGRAVPDQPVFVVSDVAYNLEIVDHGFFAYDFGKTYAKAHLIDNIRVWLGADGANWNLVYQNDFNKRVRYGVQNVQEAKLLSADVNRTGLDGWIRRGAGDADMYIRNAENPFATIEGEGSFAHAVHTLKATKKGKVTVRADIRPPTRMTGKATYPGCVYVGGDAYAQGEIGTASGLRGFTDAAAGCFGFARTGTATTLGYYSAVKLFAKGGSGESVSDVSVGMTTWYRFVATFDLDAKTWRVDVYNQGAAQPATGSGDGTLVASFENLTFAYDDPSGFSAVGIAGGGTTGSDPLAADKKGVLFDNVSVTGDDFGLMFLVK